MPLACCLPPPITYWQYDVGAASHSLVNPLPNVPPPPGLFPYPPAAPQFSLQVKSQTVQKLDDHERVEAAEVFRRDQTRNKARAPFTPSLHTSLNAYLTLIRHPSLAGPVAQLCSRARLSRHAFNMPR